MAEPTVWEGLAKSQGDPTTILEALAAAIAAHNADPNAHLDALASLQAHRTNPTADHPAESVVNDKIFPAARAYVAIVGSGADGDFATLDEAVDYAASLGGGNILLTAGDHYVSGELQIPLSINLVGVDRDAVFLHLDRAGGDFITYIADTVNDQKEAIISNLTVVADGNGCFRSYKASTGSIGRMRFVSCDFRGGQTYIEARFSTFVLQDCNVFVGENPAIDHVYGGVIRECVFVPEGIGDYCTAIYGNPLGTFGGTVYLYDSTFSLFEDMAHPTFTKDKTWTLQARDCIFESCRFDSTAPPFWRLTNCYFYMEVTTTPSLNSAGSQQLFYNNRFLLYNLGVKLTVNAVDGIMIGNFCDEGFISSNAALLWAGNVEGTLFTHSNSATAMMLHAHNVVQLTPNSSRTLTTTVPAPGERRTLIILTSGTTSYTLTFGTGFKTTGTLATGATSGRRFVIEFISDGTQLIETSRTTAIA